jgi:hypothetical protein
MNYPHSAWNRFCEQQGIKQQAVPLFAADADGQVDLIRIGRQEKAILARSQAMEEMVGGIAGLISNDHRQSGKEYEGLIYLMFKREEEQIIPLYIGKSEKYGQDGKKLSANITRARDKFCRWGYNYAYHLGDLSSVVCLAHPPAKNSLKYQSWAKVLFEAFPTAQPRLKFPVWFWMKAWSGNEAGPWLEYGATSLTFLEYQLIGVASKAFPEHLLNREGVNREDWSSFRPFIPGE